MGYDLYAFRTSVVPDLEAARVWMQSEEMPRRDAAYAEPVAHRLEALGFSRFQLDFAEAALAMDVSEEEAREILTSIELNLDSPVLQATVESYGVCFGTGWMSQQAARRALVSTLWGSLKAVSEAEPVIVFDPQIDELIAIEPDAAALGAAYERATQSVLGLMASPEFSEKVREAIEESLSKRPGGES